MWIMNGFKQNFRFCHTTINIWETNNDNDDNNDDNNNDDK